MAQRDASELSTPPLCSIFRTDSENRHEKFRCEKNEAGQAPRNYPLTYLTEINSKQAPSGTVNGKLILQKYMSVGNYFSTVVSSIAAWSIAIDKKGETRT